MITQGTLTAGSNYTIDYTEEYLTINLRPLSITANNITKVYGQEYTFVGNEFTHGDLYFTDKITGVDLSSTGAAADAALGAHTIEISNAAGTGLENYDISYVLGTMTVVDKTVLTITGLTADNKVYDGTTDVNISSYGSLVGVQSEHDVTLVTTSATASFANKNVGDGKTVTVLGLTLGGADAGSYMIGESHTTTANITALDLTLTNFTAEDKVYDGTTDVITSGFDDDRVLGDDLEFNYVAAFASANVDVDIQVNFSSITISGGADTNNYTLITTEGVSTASITTREVTITPTPGQTKIYGEDDPVFTFTESNLISGDTYTGTLSRGVGNIVGNYAYEVGSLSYGNNYTINLVPGTFTITKKALTIVPRNITKLIDTEYVFDGTEFVPDGLEYLDEIGSVELSSDGTLIGAAEGYYDINIGAITFTVGTADNYNINKTVGTLTVANITYLSLTGLTADNKVYDGDANASISNWGTLVGVQPGHSVGLVNTSATVTFSDKNVGVDKMVTVTGLDIDGDDADLYMIEDQTTVADITAVDLLVSNFVADDKIYDGTTSVNGAGFSDDRISGDLLQFTYDVAFASIDVAADIPVNFTNIELTNGADIGNYNLVTLEGTATASITAKPITVTPDADQLKLEGEVDPVLTYTNDPLIGEDAMTGLLSRETGETHGDYQILIGTLSAGGNYSIDLQPEVFTIVAVETYTLTLAVNPIDAGTATGGGEYQEGGVVTITAVPADGYQFVNWTNNGEEVSTDAAFQYTMPAANTNLVANFEEDIPQKYALTLEVNPLESGNVTGGGEYTEGAEVDLTATPVEGYQFVNWTNGDVEVSTEANFTFTMPAENTTLVANFEEIPTAYSVAITVVPEGSGSVTGTGDYYEGDEVTVTATANEGFIFQNWRVNGAVISSDQSYIFIMPGESVALEAYFIEEGTVTYELFLVANPVDGGTVIGAGTFVEGELVTVSTIATEGYTFVNWVNEDIEVSTDATFVFTMPAANTTLAANFQEIVETYTVTFNVKSNEVEIEGATITINGITETLTSDIDGIATVELESGDYEFSVAANDYEVYSGSFTVVDQDIAIEVDLTHVDVSTGILENVSVYPNPITNSINISGSYNLSRIVVSSITGSIVQDIRSVQVNSIQLDVDLPSGIYFVILIASDGSQKTIKLVRE